MICSQKIGGLDSGAEPLRNVGLWTPDLRAGGPAAKRAECDIDYYTNVYLPRVAEMSKRSRPA